MKRDISEKTIRKMMESLPYYSPSSDFTDNVMSAMGFGAQTVLSRSRKKIWFQIILEGAVAGWLMALSALVLFLVAAYAGDILSILINPSLLLANLKLYVLKFSFGVLNALNFLDCAKNIAMIFINRSNILFDLVFSTILAALTMMSVLKHSVYLNMEKNNEKTNI